MAQSTDLIIKDFSLGIGPSPHTGFGDMRNLDIYTLPGVARLNNLLAKVSSTTVTNLVQWFVKNPLNSAELFALDAAGQVYTSTDYGVTWATVSGETSGGLGQGMQIWKDYLFVARSTALDVLGPLTSGRAWTNSWKTIDSDTSWHPMIVSKNDNKLYGGAGRYVFSLDELTTFVPATAASYTFTQQAIDLPPNYRIKCMVELGNNLMMGTWMGGNVYGFKVADIFPWDRSSPSFGQPIQFEENGVNSMITIDNTIYGQVGIGGKFFSSNGVQATIIGQIPSAVSNLEGGLFLDPYPGAVINFKGRPFFGVSCGGSNNIAGMGIWSIMQTSRGNILNFEHSISTGNDGSSSTVKIGALLGITRDTLLAGWRDDSVYGIDETTNTSRYTSYAGYLESPLYTVGSNLIRRQFNQVEFQLAAALTTGQGIRIKYRTDVSASYTTIGTYDYATLGGVTSHNFKTNIPDCELIQLRVELTTGSSLNSSPQLRSVTLR